MRWGRCWLFRVDTMGGGGRNLRRLVGRSCLFQRETSSSSVVGAMLLYMVVEIVALSSRECGDVVVAGCVAYDRLYLEGT